MINISFFRQTISFWLNFYFFLFKCHIQLHQKPPSREKAVIKTINETSYSSYLSSKYGNAIELMKNCELFLSGPKLTTSFERARKTECNGLILMEKYFQVPGKIFQNTFSSINCHSLSFFFLPHMCIEERKTMAIYTGKCILKNFAENLEVILRKNQIILFSFFVATLFAFPME